MLTRDNWECQLRLEPCIRTATVADHKVPRSQGGRDTLDNLQAACEPCNLLKGNRA